MKRAPTLLFCLAARALAQDTTVVVVRHAEKASLTDLDTPLSEAGERRAQALAAQLAAFHPTVLYASERRRTQQTLAPTARRLGLTPHLRSSDAPEALGAEILARHRGATVTVAWHHGPHEPLARALGVQGPLPPWTATTYDRLWVIRIPAQGPAILEDRPQAPVPLPEPAPR
jgi:hypothetical protein